MRNFLVSIDTYCKTTSPSGEFHGLREAFEKSHISAPRANDDDAGTS